MAERMEENTSWEEQELIETNINAYECKEADWLSDKKTDS